MTQVIPGGISFGLGFDIPFVCQLPDIRFFRFGRISPNVEVVGADLSLSVYSGRVLGIRSRRPG